MPNFAGNGRALKSQKPSSMVCSWAMRNTTMHNSSNEKSILAIYAAFSRFPLAWLFLAAVVFACAPLQVRAQNVNYGEVSVYLIEEQKEQFSHGYIQYRFRVTNNDPSKPHRVTLSMPGNHPYGNGVFQSLRRSVEVGPEATAIISLLQPTIPTIHPGSNLMVEIDGKKQEDNFPLINATGKRTVYPPSFRGGGTYSTFSPGSTGITPLHLASQKVPATLDTLLTTAPPPGGYFLTPPTPRPAVRGPGSGPLPFMTKSGSPGGPGVAPPVPAMGIAGGPATITAYPPGGTGTAIAKSVKSSISIAQWSDNWLGYTAYDLVFVTLDELKELENGGAETRSILTALWRYVESGGTMVVLGKGSFSFPKAWKKSTEKAPESLNWYSAGFGNCFHVENESRESWFVAPKPLPRGRMASASDPSEAPKGIYDLVRESIQDSNQVWNQSFNTTHFQNAFPVVDNLSVPVRGLFVLMILFAIVIGPVNLVLLSRWNKRIWLLWTVPAISFFFCLAILTYHLLAEGWFSKTRIAGITILDQTEQRATSLGLTGFYCPLNPGSLRFSSLTELQIPQESHPVISGSAVLDWTEDQNLARGWVLPRVPTYFSMRKSEDRRERLTVREEASGAVEAVNALGCDIRTLYLLSSRGQMLEASGIAAGASAKLTPSAHKPGQGPYGLRKVFSSGSWFQGNRMFAGDQALSTMVGTLRPGTYLAIVESNPFLENGLKGSYERPSVSGIYGILGDPAANP